MSDDPDSPEYDWLYGSRKRSQKATENDAPEHTRVLGKLDHPRAPDLPRRDAPQEAPREIAPTPGTEYRSKKRRIPWVRLVLLLVIAWVAFLVAVPVIAWQKIAEVDAMPKGGRPADQPGTTYLLVGSDSRKGLSAEENKRLGTGGVGDVGQRTDTIMLLHTGDGPSLLLSIPRDSLVPVPGHGTTKINAAFAYGGPKLLIRTLEQTTGVKIDHYVEIGFGGFVNSVDAVGGVTICPTKKMVDRRANLNIRKGCQEVDGVTALGYARSRHTSGIGDIDRAKHQREVVAAIGKEVVTPWTVLNPWRYHRIVNAGVSSLKVSDGTGPIDLGKFALAMTRVNGKDGLTCSMPIRDLAVHWDRTRALALLKLIKTDRTADIPKRLCLPTGINQ
ncbi:MAG: LCP family protein [Nocardioidaceae bacterium]|nr:LCP family protein [Nocardioidaceae bacterium]